MSSRSNNPLRNFLAIDRREVAPVEEAEQQAAGRERDREAESERDDRGLGFGPAEARTEEVEHRRLLGAEARGRDRQSANGLDDGGYSQLLPISSRFPKHRTSKAAVAVVVVVFVEMLFVQKANTSRMFWRTMLKVCVV